MGRDALINKRLRKRLEVISTFERDAPRYTAKHSKLGIINMAALTLLEMAKQARETGDVLKAGIVEQYAGNSPILDVIAFEERSPLKKSPCHYSCNYLRVIEIRVVKTI